MRLSRASVIFIWIIISVLLCAKAIPATAAVHNTLIDPDRIRFAPLSFEPPNVESIRLANGMRLYILPDNELPLVEVKVLVRSGSTYDPIGQEGLAELTGITMRTGGVTGMDGNAVDQALELMAATFEVSVNRDYSVFGLSVLKRDLERGFDLFSKVLTEPAFDESKLTQAKELKIEELRRIYDDPQKLAFREFGLLMHEGSPRGRVVSRDSVLRIQREDLLRYHKSFFHPKNIMISISGDIESIEARKLIERHFGTWVSQVETMEPPPLPRPNEGNIFFLTKDVPQSIVIFGYLAPDKKDARFYSFEVLDFIVGSGGFRSRIFQKIRTDLGLAYSTGSFYIARPDYGLFGAYALTKSESTVEAATQIRDILNEMAQKGVSHNELELAKKAILNSFIFSFTSAEQIAFQKLMIEYEGLQEDYLETYRSRIADVQADDILNAAQWNLAPGRGVILIIGNDKVYQDISATFGKVTRIEATF